MKLSNGRKLLYSDDKLKPYKTDKLWLAVPLATASIVAGLAVTTPVNAATNEASSTNNEPTTSESNTNSSDGTTNADILDKKTSQKDVTGKDDLTDQSVTTDNSEVFDSNQSNNETVTDIKDTDNVSSVSTPRSYSSVSEYASVQKSSYDSKYQQPISYAASNPQADSIETRDTNSSDTENMQSTDSTQSSTTPTAKDNGSYVPVLANFEIGVSGKYVLYNAKAVASVLPYGTNHMAENDPLFGFYIVLPKSVTGDLDEFQTAADDYVVREEASTDISLSSLNVSQLNNTTDGREVFYFRPDDDAHVLVPDPDVNQGGTTDSKRIKLLLPIQTGADIDTTPATITINAGKDAEVPESDVLFAGIGDNFSTEPLYKTIATSDLGINAPDKNMVGISYTNSLGNSVAKTLTYTHVDVTDTYIAWDNDINARIGYPKIVTGQDGTVYERTDLTDNPANITHYFTADKYWYPSMTISDGTLTDEMVLRPTKLETSSTGAVAGNTYYVYVNEIKTKLTGNDSTINASSDSTWNPDSNVSIIAPGGNSIKISDMTGGSSAISAPGTYTYTDTEGNVLTVISTVDPTKAGTYTVKYSYVDAQKNKTFINGNTGVAKTASITATVTVKDVDKSSIATSNPNLVTGQDWPLSNGVTSLTDSNGNSVDPATAWVKSLTATDSNGDPITSIDTSKAGTQTITYHYTDPTTGKTIDSDPLTITIADNDSKLETQPMTIAKGDTSWTPLDNIKSLTDSNGDSITDLSTAKITETYFNSDGTQISAIDTAKPGQYTIKYTYTDQNGVEHADIGTAKLNVIQDSVISTKDSTIAVGKNWTPTDNVSGITDPYGNQVTISQVLGNTLTYIDNVDTITPGTYTVTYTYNDGFKTINQTANVNVINDDSQITVPDLTASSNTLVSGPSMSNWDPTIGVTLTDANDPSVTASEAFENNSLTYKITDSDGQPITGNVISSSTPSGVYKVTYDYTDSLGNKVTSSTTVTVIASGIDVVAPDKTITTGTIWSPADNITSLVDENGKDVTSSVASDLADKTLSVVMTDSNGNVVDPDNLDTSKPGTYTITYTYKDSVGNIKTATSILTIKRRSSGGSSSSGSNNENNTGDSNNNSGNGTTVLPDNNSDNGSTGDNGSSTIVDPSGDTASSTVINDKINKDENVIVSGNSTNMTGSIFTNVLSTNESSKNNLNGTDSSNSSQFPQTGEQSTTWYAQLGMFLLTILGVIGFRRKKD
ncbi:beta strand repeat-containing protein [Companilactobacillus jidongensis]|uniref:beta strand repeat-containing protein n=1 Tax=Companilactobacillus jidongensis TaxID=2486006 RepID=UPI0013DE1429|nr:bacterial Ig-like domain-containing protein [Companilactobacillus jidongensis]